MFHAKHLGLGCLAEPTDVSLVAAAAGVSQYGAQVDRR